MRRNYPKQKSYHGLSNTPTHQCWVDMRYRCENPKSPWFEDYGKRGIYVCERWQKFDNFFDDMGLKPKGMSLDRIDNDKGYEPKNCRWASPQQQSLNTRRAKPMYVDGIKLTRAEACQKFKISKSTLFVRLSLGWTDEAACKTPIARKQT